MRQFLCGLLRRHQFKFNGGNPIRQWAQQAVALGQLSVTDLKAVQASCTTNGEGNER